MTTSAYLEPLRRSRADRIARKRTGSYRGKKRSDGSRLETGLSFIVGLAPYRGTVTVGQAAEGA